jgi:hypothetical protein
MAGANYVCWEAVPVGNACVLSTVENLDRSYEMPKAIPRAGRFPSNVLFRMSDEHPKDIGLTDSLANTDTLIVASRRLKDFLEAKQLPNVEYHRVSIINHKGRVASDDYYIVHPIHAQDCLDVQRSGCIFSPIIPTEIDLVSDLTIEESRIQQGVTLFRIKSFGRPIVVHRQLAQEIMGAGFKGIFFSELEQFGH